MCDGEGCSLAHRAARNANPSVLQFLVEGKGLSISACNNVYKTPLHESCNAGLAANARLLLHLKAAINVRKGNGWTPLMYAAKSGQGDLVHLLVASKAEVEARNKEQSTALTLATRAGQTAAIAELVEAKADVRLNRIVFGLSQSNNQMGVILVCCRCGVVVICSVTVIALHAAAAQVNTQTRTRRTPLHSAIAAGHTGCVRALLAGKADICLQDGMGNTPVHECASHGQTEVLELIVETQNILIRRRERQEQQQKVNEAQGQPPARGVLKARGDYATSSGGAALAHATGTEISPGARVAQWSSDTERTPGTWRAYPHSGEVWLRTMMRVRDAVGQLPLHAAAVNGCVGILDRLLAVLRTNPDSDQTEAEGGEEFLGSAVAMLNSVDSTGCTPLHLAAVQGHAACVYRLVEAGADLEARTPPPGSRTALHCAAGWGKLGTVRALVSLKCDLSATDGAGHTALEVAKRGHAYSAKGARGWTNAEAGNLPAIATLLEVAATALEPVPPPEDADHPQEARR